MKNSDVFKNRYGYYEAVNKPTNEELAAYYEKKYFQDGKGIYDECGMYEEEEKQYFLNKIEQKYLAAKKVATESCKSWKNFLDIGTGEGWSLKFFSGRGWNCVGLDYSEYGCNACNPEQRKFLRTGDINKNLQTLFDNGDKFDLVLLDNVLEHVLDPLQLLKNIHKIVDDKGVFVVDVPNDFSILQEYLFANKKISKKYWIVQPDHLSYFNQEGLSALVKDAGWNVGSKMSDYPIDFNLVNSISNYIENPEVGKDCHKERVTIENIMHSISPEKVNALYEALADLGLGRGLMMFLTK